MSIELQDHINNYVDNYLRQSVGQKHLASVEQEFEYVTKRFAAIRVKNDNGQDITDDVLNGLLPHIDSPYHRENDYRISIWPCINRDVRSWFESNSWKKPEDWKPTAKLIYEAINGVVTNDLTPWNRFVASPYRNGFAGGFISPILFCLDQKYPVINSKVVKTYAYCMEQLGTPDSIDAALSHYFDNVAKVLKLQQRLASFGLTDILTWDMFCHYMVSKEFGGRDFTASESPVAKAQAAAWLFVANPQMYRWKEAFAKDGIVDWAGAKSTPAQKSIREDMKVGDRVFGYQAGPDYQVVCELAVASAPYAIAGGTWAIDLKPVRWLARPISLATIKSDPILVGIPFIRQPQLSVSAISIEQLNVLVQYLDETKDTTSGQPDKGPTAGTATIVVLDPVQQLCSDLQSAQYETTQPKRFEALLAQAFEMLGFESEHVGGAGKPDGVVKALLGTRSYSVVVEAKTCQKGSTLQLAQVNYASVDDHRQEYSAAYSVLVAPGFSGGRVTDQAVRYKIALVTTDDLIKLLNAHAQYPFGLEELRRLFEETASAREAIPRLTRLHNVHMEPLELLRSIVLVLDELQRQQENSEPVSANALYIVLFQQARLQRLEPPRRTQIDDVLALLSNPLVNAIDKSGDGYVLTMPPSAVSKRLQALAGAI